MLLGYKTHTYMHARMPFHLIRRTHCDPRTYLILIHSDCIYIHARICDMSTIGWFILTRIQIFDYIFSYVTALQHSRHAARRKTERISEPKILCARAFSVVDSLVLIWNGAETRTRISEVQLYKYNTDRHAHNGSHSHTQPIVIIFQKWWRWLHCSERLPALVWPVCTTVTTLNVFTFHVNACNAL